MGMEEACLSGQQLSALKTLNNAFISLKQESGVRRLVALHSYLI